MKFIKPGIMMNKISPLRRGFILLTFVMAVSGTAAFAQHNKPNERDHSRNPSVNRNNTRQPQPRVNQPRQVTQPPTRTTTVNRVTVNNNDRTRIQNNNNSRPYPNRNYNNNNYGNRPGSGGYRRPPYSATNPSWRYRSLPRRNTTIRILPSTYSVIHYGGYDYRYNNGIYYRPYESGFRVVGPPIGLFIDILPLGGRRIYVNNYPYYYYDGTYYDYRDRHYVVVSPPVGAIVESIPDGYETVTIDGETYYTVDGAQYKAVVQDNGEIWYEVIKAN